MRMALLWLLACALGAGLAVAAEPAAANRFETYPLFQADPAAVLEVVRTLAGPDATVVADDKNRRLLVLTTPERHREIAAVMAKLNAPVPNVQLEVAFSGATRDKQQEASVSGQGGVVVSGSGTRYNIKVQPKLINTTVGGTSNVRQILTVSSGREAVLTVGEQVPYLDWLMDYGLRHGVIQQRVQWQHVGARLIVEPRVIGDGPDLVIKLTPELSGMVNGQPLHTRFAAVATEITARDGQPVSLGGISDHRDFYSNFLIGASRGGRQETLDIVLTPRILAPGASGVLVRPLNRP